MAGITVNAVSRALSEAPGRSFRETVDLTANLQDLDLNGLSKRADESIVLPPGTGQDTQIVVFATGGTAFYAGDAADEVLGPDEFEGFGDDTDVAKDLVNETDFSVTEAGLMQDIGRYFGIVLGPRGKMPTPLRSDDGVVETVNRMKDTVQLRSRDRRMFHIRVGADGMAPDEIAENIDTIVRRLEATLGKGPLNIDSVHVETTMGLSVEVPA